MNVLDQLKSLHTRRHFFDRTTSRIVAMAIVILGSAFVVHSKDVEPKPVDVTTVRVEDIPRKVQLIGRCGQPLGSLLTIRGQWIRPAGQVKDDSLRLRVDFVNGTELVTKVEIHKFEVVPISLGFKEARGRKDGEAWDWRFDQGASDPPPSFQEGERFELLGVETGDFEVYSQEVWQQIGPIAVPTRPALSGPFATQLNYIAVRRLREVISK